MTRSTIPRRIALRGDAGARHGAAHPGRHPPELHPACGSLGAIGSNQTGAVRSGAHTTLAVTTGGCGLLDAARNPAAEGEPTPKPRDAEVVRLVERGCARGRLPRPVHKARRPTRRSAPSVRQCATRRPKVQRLTRGRRPQPACPTTGRRAHRGDTCATRGGAARPGAAPVAARRADSRRAREPLEWFADHAACDQRRRRHVAVRPALAHRRVRVLKSGCKVEELQHHTAERLERAMAIKMVIGWRIQLMVRSGARCPTCRATCLRPSCAMLATFARSPSPAAAGAPRRRRRSGCAPRRVAGRTRDVRPARS